MKKPTIVIASALVVALAFGGGAYYYKAQQAQEISALAGAAVQLGLGGGIQLAQQCKRLYAGKCWCFVW